MDTHAFLQSVITILLAVVIVVPLFRWVGLGAIIGYLFAGMLVGPQIFGFITDVDTMLAFSELGVVFLLFVIGLELSPSRLWQMRSRVFGLGFLQVILTALVLFLVIYPFGLSIATSAIVALGLSLSSTAFAIQLLNEKNQMNTLHGQSSFSILLFQDLAIVPLLFLVTLLSQKDNNISFDPLVVIKAAGLIIGLILAGRFLVRPILRWIAESRVQEVFTATALLVVVGVAYLVESVGLSMALGAFLAGILLANSEYRHELEVNLQPFKGLLLGLFFMAVGMSLHLEVIVNKPHWVLLGFSGLLVIKFCCVYLVGRLFRLPVESARNMAATLPQGGEFAFVLFTTAQANELLSKDWNALFSTIVTLSMAATPFVFTFNQRWQKSSRKDSSQPFDEIQDDSPKVIIAGFGRFGQILARILRSKKISFTTLEHSASQVETARKYGTKIYYGDARRKDLLLAAGANRAEILFLAIDDMKSSLQVAQLAKKSFPGLKIVARVRNRQHAIDMIKLGVPHIFRETFDSSLAASGEVLSLLGYSNEARDKTLKLFRKHDEEMLLDQVDHIDDEKSLISITNQANKQLEDILQKELKTSSS